MHGGQTGDRKKGLEARKGGGTLLGRPQNRHPEQVPLGTGSGCL